MDQHGKLIYVNQHAFSMFKYTEEQFKQGLNGFNLVVPEERGLLMKNLADVIAGKNVVPTEYTMIKGDGSKCNTLIHSSPIVNDAKLAGFRGFIIDITERKQIEEALRENEEKYRIVVEKANDAIIILQDGFIRFSNPSFANMLGFSIEESKGMSLSSFIPPENLEAVLERYQKRMVGEQLSPVFETVLFQKSGEKINVETSGSVIHFQGKLADVVIIRDITERKRIEKILLESERLSAIGEMAAGVAHDFNNSLQSIFGNLEMALLTPGISQELTGFVETAKRSTKDAAARVQQLQRFTKKEQNQDCVPIDLNLLLDEAVLQLHPIWKDDAEKKGLKISFQKSYEKIGFMDGHIGELGSAVHNIIKNAIEAMPDGGTITLKTGVKDNEIYVRIIDTGIGMDENTRKRVFQPFFSTKGYEAGRGLGMSAVFAIIRDHNGKISINSEIGKGTTMEILFPLGTKKKESKKEETLGACQISGRVLWVDDEPEIRNIGKIFLEMLGHSADIAGSGSEALELLKNNCYDLLITDVGMPGMSGWQLAEAIKGKYAGLKVAVVSGWGAGVSNEEKAKYGVGYVLGKPIGIEEIKNLVGEALQSRI